ncbi:hypothetical protein ACFLU5_02770 [Bacteroidota bacterium]
MKLIQAISLILVVSILFQSCKIYTPPVSVDHAIEKQPNIVKIATKYGQVFEFDHIEINGDTLMGKGYGISNIDLFRTFAFGSAIDFVDAIDIKKTGKYHINKIPIEDIDEIKLLNKSGSTIATITVTVLGTALVIALGILLIILLLIKIAENA